MKNVSETVGGSRLRRIVLPGAVVAIYAHAYIRSWISTEGTLLYGMTEGLVLTVEIVLFGIILSSALIPIYHVYEGFRWSWLTHPAREWNERRKKQAREGLVQLYKGRRFQQLDEEEKNRARAFNAVLADFPVERRGMKPTYLVERPTRLGNIIAGYELYPASRYGIDGLAFWSHLLILAPEAARKEYEEAMLFAESLVLTSAAGALVALAAAGALVGRLLGLAVGVLVPVGPSTVIDVLALTGGLAIWSLFYRLALPAHREVRSAFRAVTDLGLPELVKWLEKIELPLSPAVTTRAAAVSRYLEVLAGGRIPPLVTTGSDAEGAEPEKAPAVAQETVDDAVAKLAPAVGEAEAPSVAGRSSMSARASHDPPATTQPHGG